MNTGLIVGMAVVLGNLQCWAQDVPKSFNVAERHLTEEAANTGNTIGLEHAMEETKVAAFKRLFNIKTDAKNNKGLPVLDDEFFANNKEEGAKQAGKEADWLVAKGLARRWHCFIIRTEDVGTKVRRAKPLITLVREQTTFDAQTGGYTIAITYRKYDNYGREKNLENHAKEKFYDETETAIVISGNLKTGESSTDRITYQKTTTKSYKTDPICTPEYS